MAEVRWAEPALADLALRRDYLGQHSPDATNPLNAGTERVDIQALLGPESVATTQIYAHVGQARMEQGVATW